MKAFDIKTEIKEFDNFTAFADEAKIGNQDLILTGEHTYLEFIEPSGVEAQTLFREKYGKGEPTDSMINAILSELSGRKFDRIIAVGGGSIIDIAKAVAVAWEGADVDALYEKGEKLKKEHRLIVLPTSCGTGSEVTNISVINRVSRGVKMGLAAKAMYPDEAVLITSLLDSLPYKIFATSSIDAMIHSVESFLSPNGCSFSRLFSKEALRMIVSSWDKTIANGGADAWKEYKAEFLRASTEAGIAFGYAGCAAVHALSYPLGSVYHIPHGQSNQLMFKDVMKKYKEKAAGGRINELEEILAGLLRVEPEDSLEGLYSLMDNILKKEPLRNFGVKEEDLEIFAGEVLKTQQRLLKNNYIALTEEDILDIYRAAF